MKRMIARWNQLSLFKQMSMSTLVISLIAIFVVAVSVVMTCSDEVIQTLSDTMLGNIRNNNQILNDQMRIIENRSNTLLVNRELYAMFDEGLPDEFSQLNMLDERVVQPLLAQLFDLPLEPAAFIYTGSYVFGSTAEMHLPLDTFSETELNHVATAADGRLAWVSTFDFAQTMLKPKMSNAEYQYRTLFAAVRELNLIRVDSSRNRFTPLPSDIAPPILAVLVRESTLRSMYTQLINYNAANYWIFDREGRVVSSSERAFEAGLTVPKALFELHGMSGVKSGRLDGIESIICYDTLPVADWTVGVVIPRREVISSIYAQLIPTTLSAIVILVLVTVMLCLAISYQFSHPITKLKDAMLRIGAGELDASVAPVANQEMNALASGINDMSDRLRTLIYDNFESKLREKESQLQALNFQINPHFLYNTLSTINYMSIEAGQSQISEVLVSLSSMLHYAVHYQGDFAPLRVEIEWLSHYTRIMTMRYIGQIQFEQHVDGGLMDCIVPKLFLQPIIENAYQHGCAAKNHGLIELSVTRSDAVLRITVKDDGVGMAQEQIAKVFGGSPRSNIGLHNVIARLSHLYGDAFRIRIENGKCAGTVVTVELPYQE